MKDLNKNQLKARIRNLEEMTSLLEEINELRREMVNKTLRLCDAKNKFGLMEEEVAAFNKAVTAMNKEHYPLERDANQMLHDMLEELESRG